jgi:hypothetical protein
MRETEAQIGAASKVRATINYIGAMDVEPYMYYSEPPEGRPYTNVVDDPHEVEIADLRGRADGLSLAEDSFIFTRHGHSFADFHNDDLIRSTYYAEVEQYFRELLDVERVFAYDFAVRKPDHGPKRPDGIPVGGTRRRPIKRAHGDFIQPSFEQMVKDLGERCGADPLAGRHRGFNLWRPVRGPLTDGPLALCHPASVADEDHLPMRQFTEHRENQIAAIRYNPAHRWCYMSGMQADEAIIFSSYDSTKPCRSGVIGHCAFDDPTRPADGLPRESIEVRVLVFGG